MERLEPSAIVSAVLASPAWVRLGLTVRDARMRERAAEELASCIDARISNREEPDERQLALPIS